jgi:hypothetical protein
VTKRGKQRRRPWKVVDIGAPAAARDRSPLKHAGLPDFSREFGLKLGDLGVAFWRHAGSGSVNRTFFIYGDKGPANKLGEGSVRMADELRIPSNPNTGGLDASEVADLRKGVIHIAFSGSGAAFLGRQWHSRRGVVSITHAQRPMGIGHLSALVVCPYDQDLILI